METYRFIQLDVFTQEPFAGNSLAVFPEAEGLTDEESAAGEDYLSLMRKNLETLRVALGCS